MSRALTKLINRPFRHLPYPPDIRLVSAAEGAVARQRPEEIVLQVKRNKNPIVVKKEKTSYDLVSVKNLFEVC